MTLLGVVPADATPEAVGEFGPGAPGTVTDDHGDGTVWIVDVDVNALVNALVPAVSEIPDELSCDDPPLHMETPSGGSPLVFVHQHGSVTLDVQGTMVGSMNVWDGLPPDGVCTRFATSSWSGASDGATFLVTFLRGAGGDWTVAGGTVDLPDRTTFSIHTDTPTGRTYMVEHAPGPVEDDEDNGDGSSGGPSLLPGTS